jgi:hypothetical protein
MPESNGWEQRDLVPRPDPTLLTNAAIEQVTLQYRRELSALRELLNIRIDNLGMLLDERYATQTKALDAAFVAAEKATATALASAEKAVGVAAASNEARFQSVNEFRKTLSDQATSFLPRLEYTSAHKALEDKLALVNELVSKLELRLSSRLDRGEGTAAGEAVQRGEQRAGRTDLNQVIIPVIMVISVLASVVFGILLALKK